jgi:hypothetical protein
MICNQSIKPTLPADDGRKVVQHGGPQQLDAVAVAQQDDLVDGRVSSVGFSCGGGWTRLVVVGRYMYGWLKGRWDLFAP